MPRPYWFIASILLPLAAHAEEARVIAAEASRAAGGWTIAVTIRSDDTGWESYADGWRVEAPDGTVLGTRVLAHPHVNEQPFTRSLGNLALPDGLAHVLIRARMLNTDWQPETFTLALPAD